MGRFVCGNEAERRPRVFERGSKLALFRSMIKLKYLALFIALPAASAVAGPSQDTCKAIRTVEMRNAVLASHLLCKHVISADDYNSFIIANRRRIQRANKIAVAYYMDCDGSRVRFDKLDSQQMNSVASASSVNPAAFCEKIQTLKHLISSENIDDLLATQKLIEIVNCAN